MDDLPIVFNTSIVFGENKTIRFKTTKGTEMKIVSNPKIPIHLIEVKEVPIINMNLKAERLFINDIPEWCYNCKENCKHKDLTELEYLI